jgi:ribonuclease HI
VDSVNLGWIKKWQANGWKRSGKEKAKNIDLLQRLLKQLDRHEVSFVWVKGHDGHPENERCDTLAVNAAKSDNLLDDEGYNA